MIDFSEIGHIGIASGWRSRKSLVKDLRNHNQSTMARVVAYNSRQDTKNNINLLPSVPYSSVGASWQMDAIAVALDCGERWKDELARSVANLMFADRLGYFWHRQYDLLFPSKAGQLRLMDWVFMTNSMAFALLLGWTDQAIYQGYLTYAVLNRQYELQLSYEQHHRRAHAFMLRLFADWRGDDIGHEWPPFADDVPVYIGILERWRDPDPSTIAPWLLAACDRHTHEGRYDTDLAQFDFGDYRVTRTPIEILMVYRLRQLLGLSNPVLEHPLMESPFDCLPEMQPSFGQDEFMQGTLVRARQDWPRFDEVTSSDALLSEARTKNRQSM